MRGSDCATVGSDDIVAEFVKKRVLTAEEASDLLEVALEERGEIDRLDLGHFMVHTIVINGQPLLLTASAVGQSTVMALR